FSGPPEQKFAPSRQYADAKFGVSPSWGPSCVLGSPLRRPRFGEFGTYLVKRLDHDRDSLSSRNERENEGPTVRLKMVPLNWLSNEVGSAIDAEPDMLILANFAIDEYL